MIEAAQLIFLQLQKTGCTHVARLLNETMGAQECGVKHSRLPSSRRGADKLILGGVRNPWDWYVSFFAYACERRGGITAKYLLAPLSVKRRLNNPRLKYVPFSRRMARITDFLSHELHRRTEDWAELLDDVSDVVKFRRFLHRLLDPSHRFSAAVDYGFSPYSTEIGLFSYLYLYLYLDDVATLFASDDAFVRDMRRPADLRHRLIVDRFIPMETMTESLADALEAVGEAVAAESIRRRDNGERTNASQRDRDYRAFYDAETRALIAVREGIVIQQHGYEF